jgi:MATE family multidrug resistance protein
MGKMRPVVFFTIFNVLLTIFFSYVFIFGVFSFPNLGIAGAGWGITVSSFITLLAMFIYFVYFSPYKIYIKHILYFAKPQFLIDLLSIGFPVGLMYSLEVGFFFAMTLLIGTYGHQLLAANQVALQYLGLLIGSIFSIAQAITVRMGHLLGSGSIRQAKNCLYVGIRLAFMFVLLFSLMDWLFPNLLIRLDFNKNQSQLPIVFEKAKLFLWMVGIFQLLEAVRIGLFGALRALKDTHFTMISSFIIFWILAFPAGTFLELKFNCQGLGIWLSLNISIIIGIIWLKKRFSYGLLKYIRQ